MRQGVSSSDPLISVVIPCYRQAHFLSQAITSVLQQTYPCWECLIVDDASDDDTCKVADGFADSDPRIRLVSSDRNRGLAGARNLGISQASGEWLLPLDADDRIALDYMQHAVAAIQLNADVKLVYGRAEYFGEKSGPWPLPDYHYGLLLGRNPIHCSAFFRRADWERLGGYNESLRHGLEDWDFWLRLIGPDDKVHQLDSVGLYYRQHADSMMRSLQADDNHYEERFQEMMASHLPSILNWTRHYLQPLLDAWQLQRAREARVGRHPLARLLYAIAHRISQ